MASLELICPECEKIVSSDDINQIFPSYCSFCLKKGKYIAIVFINCYFEEQRQRELRRRLYCSECGHIGLIEQFSFNAPSEDNMRERCCPRCHTDNAVNMGTVKMCENCDEVPATKGEIWCKVCIDTYNKAFIER